MSQEKSPIFLARNAYSQRRLTDAARLMPLLGVGLFLLPLLWKAPIDAALGEGMRTVGVMLYLFLVWVFLAGLAMLVSRRLAFSEAAETRDAETWSPQDATTTVAVSEAEANLASGSNQER